jgi:D-alanyl-D-alanine carboxypeptidase/D-alanyl-D-alanine-endopeptidase (penicillin-binding protein 4)
MRRAWLFFLKRLVASLLLGVAAGAAVAQALPPQLQKAWQATGLPQSALSLVVREVGGGGMVAVNAQTPRNPASVMKMVTTWSGLSGLGPDYQWRTTLLGRDGGRVDAQGTLHGPLYVKAGGDPFLTIQDLWNLLRELRLRGIKNLNEVVVDRSIFGNVATDPGDFDDSPYRPYNASPDAMMVSLGAVRLLFEPDAAAKKWVPIVDPPLSGVRVDGHVKWSNARCPGSPSVSVTETASEHDNIVIHVEGTAAGSCGEFSVYRLAMSQPDYFAAVFRMLWRDLGGTLARGVRSGRVPSSAQPIVWHDSVSLSDTIRTINKHSNNVMARTLLLTLGAEMNGPGATPASGANAALSILAAQHVDTHGWHIVNGAGLARGSRLTAAGLAGMLDTAWRSPLMPEFVSSLSISGLDGTMRHRLRGDDTRGVAHLKTGTLRNACSLAGYVRGKSGKRYIVVSFVNDDRAGAARPFDDAVIAWLADS